MNVKEFEETACPFCGQIRLGGGDCDCDGAKRARKIEDQIKRAADTIDDLFGESCKERGYKPLPEKEIGTLNVLAELIVNYKMHQAMLSFAGGIRAKLSHGAKGAIKVERSETKKGFRRSQGISFLIYWNILENQCRILFF